MCPDLGFDFEPEALDETDPNASIFGRKSAYAQRKEKEKMRKELQEKTGKKFYGKRIKIA